MCSRMCVRNLSFTRNELVWFYMVNLIFAHSLNKIYIFFSISFSMYMVMRMDLILNKKKMSPFVNPLNESFWVFSHRQTSKSYFIINHTKATVACKLHNFSLVFVLLIFTLPIQTWAFKRVNSVRLLCCYSSD